MILLPIWIVSQSQFYIYLVVFFNIPVQQTHKKGLYLLYHQYCSILGSSSSIFMSNYMLLMVYWNNNEPQLLSTLTISASFLHLEQLYTEQLGLGLNSANYPHLLHTLRLYESECSQNFSCNILLVALLYSVSFSISPMRDPPACLRPDTGCLVRMSLFDSSTIYLPVTANFQSL